MPKMLVNDDAYQWLAPNPTPNQPPVVRTGHRGEIIEVSEEEAKRGRENVTVRVYAIAGGSSTSRSEPSLLDPSESDAQRGAAQAAADAARRQTLQAELAEIDARGTDIDEPADGPKRTSRAGR